MVNSDLNVNLSVVAYLDQVAAAQECNDSLPLPPKGLRDKVNDLAKHCRRMQRRMSPPSTAESEYHEALQHVYAALQHVYEGVVRLIDTNGVSASDGRGEDPIVT